MRHAYIEDSPACFSTRNWDHEDMGGEDFDGRVYHDWLFTHETTAKGHTIEVSRDRDSLSLSVYGKQCATVQVPLTDVNDLLEAIDYCASAPEIIAHVNLGPDWYPDLDSDRFSLMREGAYFFWVYETGDGSWIEIKHVDGKARIEVYEDCPNNRTFKKTSARAHIYIDLDTSNDLSAIVDFLSE